MRFQSLVLAGSLIAAVARADDTAISIAHARSRPAIAGTVGVVYLDITDSGAPDRLLSASTPLAERAELHETTNVDGVTRMRPIASLPVSAEKLVRLAPGSYHLMLAHLSRPLVAGDHFPLTLTFEHAGARTVDVTVDAQAGGHAVGASASVPSMSMDHMH